MLGSHPLGVISGGFRPQLGWIIVALAAIGSTASLQANDGTKIRLGGEPVSGVVLKGSEIPQHRVVGSWLGHLANWHRDEPWIYQLEIKEVGIEPGSEAEGALIATLGDRYFDPETRRQRPVLDLATPGAKEEMHRRGLEDARTIGRIFRTLVRGLEKAGYDRPLLETRLARWRDGMSVTFLHDPDPSPTLRLEAQAFERALALPEDSP